MINKQIIIKSGNWLYDNILKKKVIIIEQNWDNYYEEGFTEGIEELNEYGLLYYVIFGDYSYDTYSNIVSMNISESCLSVLDAINLAESKVGKIDWDI